MTHQRATNNLEFIDALLTRTVTDADRTRVLQASAMFAEVFAPFRSASAYFTVLHETATLAGEYYDDYLADLDDTRLVAVDAMLLAFAAVLEVSRGRTEGEDT